MGIDEAGEESGVEILGCFWPVFSSEFGVVGLVVVLVAQSCLTLCDPMDCSTPGIPVLHYIPELAQTHVH